MKIAKPNHPLWKQRRVDARWKALMGLGLPPRDANLVARFLEYRTISHERLGGEVRVELHQEKAA